MNIKKDIVKNFGFKEKTTIKAGVDLNLDLDYKNKSTEEVFLLSKRDKKELIDNVINKSRGITGIEKIEYKIGTKIFTLTYSKSYQKSGYSLEAKDPNDKIKRIYYSPNLSELTSYSNGSSKSYSNLYRYKLRILRKDDNYIRNEFEFDEEIIGNKIENTYFGGNIYDILNTFGEVE